MFNKIGFNPNSFSSLEAQQKKKTEQTIGVPESNQEISPVTETGDPAYEQKEGQKEEKREELLEQINKNRIEMSKPSQEEEVRMSGLLEQIKNGGMKQPKPPEMSAEEKTARSNRWQTKNTEQQGPTKGEVQREKYWGQKPPEPPQNRAI